MNVSFSTVLNINKNTFNGISIEEKKFTGKINLRGKSTDKDFMKCVGKVLDLVLPIEPNVRIFKKNINIVWLSPNEWLVETPKTELENVFKQLKSSLNPKKTAVTDVSFNKTVLTITGKNIFTLLSKYVVIDIEEALKTNHSVAQTIFIKIPILLIRNNDNGGMTSIDIHINRSHAKYVYGLLIDGTKILDI